MLVLHTLLRSSSSLATRKELFKTHTRVTRGSNAVLCHSINFNGADCGGSFSSTGVTEMEQGSRLSFGKAPVVQVSVKACKERNSCVVESINCESGASVLFDVMHDDLSAIDLYSRWGKVWQCGGSGRCGQCRVKVCRGHDLLSPKTSVEQDHLKGMPWQRCRLACQAQVGNGSNGGEIEISLE